MAVTKRTAKPAPSAEASSPTEQAAACYVQLVNDCSTYVTPEREIFYSRDPSSQKPRVYEVDEGSLARLLKYRDDYGRKFFREVERPDEPEEERKIEIAQVVRLPLRGEPEPEAPRQTRSRLQGVGSGEIDTGAVRLQDDEGGEVGVRV